MECFDFTLKLLSPAFVAGAMTQKRTHDEKSVDYVIIGPDGDGLRVPSLRGVLRFWFRAIHAYLEPAELKAREAKLFGDTETGQGIRIIPLDSGRNAKGGPLSENSRSEMQNSGSNASNDNNCKKKIVKSNPGGWSPIIVERGKKNCDNSAAYLGYGPILFQKGKGPTSHNKERYRDAIPDQTTFGFRAIGSEKQIEQLKRVLKFVHLFGGIGARSRRGWGALSVCSPWLFQSKFRGNPVKWLQEALVECMPGKILGDKPGFTAFSTYTELAVFTSGKNGWKKIFGEFYKRFDAVRLWGHNKTNKPKIAREDHDLALCHISGKKLDKLPKRLGYGLPYKIQFKQKKAVEYKPRYDGPNTEITRRASPLILSIFETEDGKTHGIALYLKSKFWGRGEVKVVADIKNGKSSTKIPLNSNLPVSEKAVDTFMDLPDKSNFNLMKIYGK